MYYLVERDTCTGKWETNFTMYGLTVEDLLGKLSGRWQELGYMFDRPCAICYRNSVTGKEIGMIFSIF